MDNSETVKMNTQFIDDFINELQAKKDIICSEFDEHISIYESLTDMGAIAGDAAARLPEMAYGMKSLEGDLNAYLTQMIQKIGEIKTQRIASDQRASQTFQDIASQTDAYRSSGE